MFIKSKNIQFLFFIYFFSTFSPYLNSVSSLTDFVPIHEAFVPKFTDPTPLTYINQTPPKPILENIPPKTHEDAIWISGYWAWVEAKNDFTWICGVWRRPPIDHFWITGSWNQTAQGWIWAKGFWSNIPSNQLVYLEKAPPASITDKIPPSPGENYFWIPGNWNFSINSKNYNWLSGKWEPANQNWILSPASYIWRPLGYVFVPIFWDWPLNARGTAYNCNSSDGPLTVLEPEIIVQNLFFFYPDYNIFYWHWWHFHPEWNWDSCGCIPPWWHWNDWWFFGWSDSWNLWWWWTHPGAFPPFWLSLDLSFEIAPPPLVIVDSFKKITKPPFNLKPGNTPLLPKGTPGKKNIPHPLPSISNDTTPGGQVTLPKEPKTQIVTPPAPTTLTPPRTSPNRSDDPGYYPKPSYPSQQIPPHKTPPKAPPTQTSPRTPNYPTKPSTSKPQGTHPNYTPPRQTPPKTPPRTPPKTPPTQTPPRTPNYPIKPSTSKPQGTRPNYTPPRQTAPSNMPNFPKDTSKPNSSLYQTK